MTIATTLLPFWCSCAESPINAQSIAEHGQRVQMDLSFTKHLDQLIDRLKSELVQHYEKDVASKDKAPPEVPHGSPHILRLTGSKSLLGDWRARTPKSLLNRRTIPDSDGSSEELEPVPGVQHRLHSKSAMSDDSEATADSVELKTPKRPSRQEVLRIAALPTLPRPLEPKTPPFSPATAPATAPKMLLPAKVAPTMSETSSQLEAVASLRIPGGIEAPGSEDSASDTTSQAPSAASARGAPSAPADPAPTPRAAAAWRRRPAP